jgi:hypothetical protein
MTRWNRASLAKLAEVADLDCHIETDKDPAGPRQFFWRFNSMVGHPLGHPIKAARFLAFALRRGAGDTVLLTMKPKTMFNPAWGVQRFG